MKILKFLAGICLFALPCMLLAQEIALPQEATDTIDSLVKNAVPNTIMLSSIFVLIVQILKKVLLTVKIDISGIKSQIVAVLVAVLYVLISTNVWEDGSLSQKDIVTVIEAVISTIAGIFGYKLLWKTPTSLPEDIEKEDVTPKENPKV